MLSTCVELLQSSSNVVTPLFLTGSSLCVTVLAAGFFSARVKEYVRCKRKLSTEVNRLFDVNNGTLMLVKQYVVLSLVVAELVSKMSTSRSRWYVLYLALRTVRPTSLREYLLMMYHVNRARPLTGLSGIKAWFTSAL